MNSAAQTITFANPGTQTVGTPLTLSATASSGLSVAFTSTTPSVCTVSGTTATFIATGTCTIDANQAGNSTYAAATMVPQSFTVNSTSQTITFANPGTQTVGTPLTLSATASSGLAVSFHLDDHRRLHGLRHHGHIYRLGHLHHRRNQAGNSSYAAATMVPQSFTVNGDSADHHLRQSRNADRGNAADAFGHGQLRPGGQLSPRPRPASARSPARRPHSIATGTCTIDANQAGNSAYAAATMVAQSFTVNGEAQTITFAHPGTQTVGTPLTLSATATSGLAVTFTSTTTSICTVSGTTATFIASGTCTIDANQAGNSTYAAATMVPQSFTVNGESQTISFGAIAAQTVGTPLTLSATATSGLAVTFTSTTTGLHGFRHDGHIYHLGHLHHRRESGGQQHLRGGHDGAAELHRQR